MSDSYSVEEACAILGVSRNRVYDAIRRNELPSIGVGRRAVIPRLALDRLMKDGPPEWAKNAWDATTPEQQARQLR